MILSGSFFMKIYTNLDCFSHSSGFEHCINLLLYHQILLISMINDIWYHCNFCMNISVYHSNHSTTPRSGFPSFTISIVQNMQTKTTNKAPVFSAMGLTRKEIQLVSDTSTLKKKEIQRNNNKHSRRFCGDAKNSTGVAEFRMTVSLHSRIQTCSSTCTQLVSKRNETSTGNSSLLFRWSAVTEVVKICNPF